MFRAILAPALLLTLFAPAAQSALVRFTVNGVIGAPTRTFFDPPALEGSAFTAFWEIDEAAAPTLELTSSIFYHQTPFYLNIPGSSVAAGFNNSMINFDLQFPAVVATFSPGGIGHWEMVFIPVPWNMNAANRQFTLGTSALTLGNLLADAEYGLASGTLTIEAVPEPATGALLVMAAAAAAAASRSSRRGQR